MVLEDFLLHPTGIFRFNFYFVWIVDIHIDRHKCGQTSRSLVGAEIQTSCYDKASSCSYYMLLVSCYFSLWTHALFGRTSFLIHYRHCFYNALFIHLSLLLHKDFFRTAKTTIVCSGSNLSKTTERRRNSTDHCTIQEDSV